MNRYKKGADFERQIVLDFWDKGWAAVRSAGSGTRSQPVPDVVAAKKGRFIAVECKTTVKDRLSLRSAVEGLVGYNDIAGGEAYLAVKFLREKPRFYNLERLLGKKDKTIRLQDEYESFDMMLGEQSKL
ncbi:MAG: Holliday junction resolvase Hjc [Candidatus Altiarchaeota archaeon]